MSDTVIPVLLYHSVSDHPPRSDSWGSVSRAEFAAHAAVIAASGRQSMTITHLAAGLRGKAPLPARPVAVTFDDGYSDTTAAVNLLLSHGVVSTVYVTSGVIGCAGRMSREQLAALAQHRNVEIGAHGIHHRRLDELDDEALATELCGSKLVLENVAGRPVESFSYPHGSYDLRVRDAVAAASYLSACAVKNAVSHPGDDPFAIARWTVTSATPPHRLAQVLEGRNVPLSWSRERLRTRAYRVIRQRRRRLSRPGGRPR